MGRPRTGTAPSLQNDPRSRNDKPILPSDISAPFTLDSQNRLALRTDGGLYTTPQGTVEARVDHGIGIQTGSPKRIVARTSRTVVIDREGNLAANIAPADVLGLREYVLSLIRSNGLDISYAEPLVADAYTDPEAPLLYTDDGTDVVVSEILH